LQTPPNYARQLPNPSASSPSLRLIDLAQAFKLSTPTDTTPEVEITKVEEETTAKSHRQRQDDQIRKAVYNDNPSYPDSWKYNPEDPNACRDAYMSAMQEDDEKYPANIASAYYRDEQNKLQFYARQYSPPGAPDAHLIRVAFVGPADKDYPCSPPVKYVVLGSDEEVAARADGYVPFRKNPPPVDFETMKDIRTCEQPVDTNPTGAWDNDTAKFFPRAVKNLRQLFGDEAWRPEFPIPETKGDEQPRGGEQTPPDGSPPADG
jgi:hypothetical protein